jgi:DNA-directed RNA polymerase subunit RPC12/RpoP
MITHCKKCGNPLDMPVSEHWIGSNIFLCGICKAEVEDEEEQRQLFNPPEISQPYKP